MLELIKLLSYYIKPSFYFMRYNKRVNNVDLYISDNNALSVIAIDNFNYR